MTVSRKMLYLQKSSYIKMKIVHISDTHGCHHRIHNLPQGDMIVHSGDFTMVGTEKEAIDFLHWFCDLPFKYKIFICGNHDECLYGAEINGLGKSVHYLNHSGIEIEGIKFYGIPMFMKDCISGRQEISYAQIPLDTDVLITHCPAYKKLDYDDNVHYGSQELWQQLEIIRPKAHLFGHIHTQHGIVRDPYTIFSNGAILNTNYTDMNSPNLIEYM